MIGLVTAAAFAVGAIPPWNPALPVVTADGWTMVWTVCRGLHGPHQPGDSLCHRWFDNNGDATVDLKDYSNWLSR